MQGTLPHVPSYSLVVIYGKLFFCLKGRQALLGHYLCSANSIIVSGKNVHPHFLRIANCNGKGYICDMECLIDTSPAKVHGNVQHLWHCGWKVELCVRNS